MILDNQTLFSDQQAITATAGSTNVIDLKANGIPYGNVEAIKRDIGKGDPVPLLVQVTQTFNTLTSLEFKVQTSDDPAFGSGNVDHYTSGAVLLASLVAGYKINTSILPEGGAAGMKRYMRLLYTVAGTNPTLGKVTACITMGVQTNG
jgi:hypothetical protein